MTTSNGSVGTSIADALSASGWATTVIDDAAIDFTEFAQVQRSFRTAATRGACPTLVVHALTMRETSPRCVASMDFTEWQRRCEVPLREAWNCAAAAYESLRAHGGHLVFVLPTARLTGLAGHVADAAALEGVRGLAKSAARQWGGHRITVNVLVLRSGDDDLDTRSRFVPAIGRSVDADRDAAEVISLLATSAARVITGSTVGLDGGMLMLP